MLRAAIDHLANRTIADDYFRRSVTIYTSNSSTPVTTARQVSFQPDIARGKIELPRNIVDRAIDFLRTPFPTETMQQLRYMRSVLP